MNNVCQEEKASDLIRNGLRKIIGETKWLDPQNDDLTPVIENKYNKFGCWKAQIGTFEWFATKNTSQRDTWTRNKYIQNGNLNCLITSLTERVNDYSFSLQQLVSKIEVKTKKKRGGENFTTRT